MPNVLYYSSNYGQYGSWIFRNNDIYEVYSGRNEGYVYNRIGSHSEDYGINFETHQCNGYFGLGITGEIDNQDSVGYAIVYIWGVPDSLYLLVSYDNFENFEVQNVFYGPEEPIGTLTRGFYSGELYTIGGDWATLRYSNNYGFSWEVKNTLYFNNVTDAGIVGGRQPGEIYVFKNYIQLMWQIAHTYIYHSLDYGETFEVYHPISFGPPPYYANFEADSLTGTVPLSVQFTDLSSGENIQNWEWDFQNDGIIDSYEQNPEYTYQDTGSYSVRLLIDFGGFDILIRQNYIHVTSGQSCNEHNIQNPSAIKLTNYPNP
ncbi:MAG: PKD domain-containing protein, partial [Candidatus Cloacimonetes bacterium]|nr:PKD domain-containing protein [Candidatus Cloacimonadota bacterium]